ncbi:hypothetical protein G3I76_49850, partial [Streptomyces sp. SID11233]|nr:hypothetical protein [Streptomyces sp. SID11233]
MLGATGSGRSEGAVMGVGQYRAVSGSGRVDDPSEEALFRMVSGLDGGRSGFVVLAPEEPDPRWWAAV